MSYARRNARQRGLDLVRKATASVAVAGLLGTGAFTVLEANRQGGSSTKSSTQTNGSSGAPVQQSTGEESSSLANQSEQSFGGDEGNVGTFSQPSSNPSNAVTQGGNAVNQGGIVVSGGS